MGKHFENIEKQFSNVFPELSGRRVVYVKTISRKIDFVRYCIGDTVSLIHMQILPFLFSISFFQL